MEGSTTQKKKKEKGISAFTIYVSEVFDHFKYKLEKKSGKKKSVHLPISLILPFASNYLQSTPKTTKNWP